MGFISSAPSINGEYWRLDYTIGTFDTKNEVIPMTFVLSARSSSAVNGSGIDSHCKVTVKDKKNNIIYQCDYYADNLVFNGTSVNTNSGNANMEGGTGYFTVNFEVIFFDGQNNGAYISSSETLHFSNAYTNCTADYLTTTTSALVGENSVISLSWSGTGGKNNPIKNFIIVADVTSTGTRPQKNQTHTFRRTYNSDTKSAKINLKEIIPNNFNSKRGYSIAFALFVTGSAISGGYDSETFAHCSRIFKINRLPVLQSTGGGSYGSGQVTETFNITGIDSEGSDLTYYIRKDEGQWNKIGSASSGVKFSYVVTFNNDTDLLEEHIVEFKANDGLEDSQILKSKLTAPAKLKLTAEVVGNSHSVNDTIISGYVTEPICKIQMTGGMAPRGSVFLYIQESNADNIHSINLETSFSKDDSTLTFGDIRQYIETYLKKDLTYWFKLTVVDDSTREDAVYETNKLQLRKAPQIKTETEVTYFKNVIQLSFDKKDTAYPYIKIQEGKNVLGTFQLDRDISVNLKVTTGAKEFGFVALNSGKTIEVDLGVYNNFFCVYDLPPNFNFTIARTLINFFPVNEGDSIDNIRQNVYFSVLNITGTDPADLNFPTRLKEYGIFLQFNEKNEPFFSTSGFNIQLKYGNNVQKFDLYIGENSDAQTLALYIKKEEFFEWLKNVINEKNNQQKIEATLCYGIKEGTQTPSPLSQHSGIININFNGLIIVENEKLNITNFATNLQANELKEGSQVTISGYIKAYNKINKPSLLCFYKDGTEQKMLQVRTTNFTFSEEPDINEQYTANFELVFSVDEVVFSKKKIEKKECNFKIKYSTKGTEAIKERVELYNIYEHSTTNIDLRIMTGEYYTNDSTKSNVIDLNSSYSYLGGQYEKINKKISVFYGLTKEKVDIGIKENIPWPEEINTGKISLSLTENVPEYTKIYLKLKFETWFSGDESHVKTFYSNIFLAYKLTPTVNYRPNRIGINISSTLLDYGHYDDAVLVIRPSTGKNKIYFGISGQEAEFNLDTAELSYFDIQNQRKRSINFKTGLISGFAISSG